MGIVVACVILCAVAALDALLIAAVGKLERERAKKRREPLSLDKTGRYGVIGKRGRK